jgi:hypothetical protein
MSVLTAWLVGLGVFIGSIVLWGWYFRRLLTGRLGELDLAIARSYTATDKLTAVLREEDARKAAEVARRAKEAALLAEARAVVAQVLPAAAAAQDAYEEAHRLRQQGRHIRVLSDRHGAYDSDQRIVAIQHRVERLLHEQNLPYDWPELGAVVKSLLEG